MPRITHHPSPIPPTINHQPSCPILIKEDGSAKPDANSYASVAEGDTYHEAHLYATAWTAATPETKEKALLMATRLIDGQYQFHGFRATSTQALQWPRQSCPDPDQQQTTWGLSQHRRLRPLQPHPPSPGAGHL